MKRTGYFLGLCLLLLLAAPLAQATDLSPAAVGWGNLVVPGLGATLRGEASEGLIEAGLELGLFFGGTFGVREGAFSIDTTIVLPSRGNLYRPLLGLTMQEIGLKVHMFNTFFHYQQASLAMREQEREKENLQPIYTGTWSDVLFAPFRWENLSSPWVYGFLLPITAYLVVDYSTGNPPPNNYHSTGTENVLYGVYNMGWEPLGSAFGEEPAFRGFLQRELTSYTGSVYLSILLQSVLFTALHPNENRVPAFVGGLYFGYLTHRFHGNFEQAVATHFWVNVTNGFVGFLNFLRAQHVAAGTNRPASSGMPMGFTFSMPL